MRTNRDGLLTWRGILLALVLSSAGCFSAVKLKEKDAAGPKVDTSTLDTSQAGIDAFNGSGGRVVIDASVGGGGGGPSNGGSGEGGVLGGGGSLSTGGNSGSGGAVVDASTPDAPLLNDAPDAPMTLPNGSLCTADGQCSSGSCVDGHCCDGKCAGNCESCVTGTCSFTSTPRKACSGSGKCVGICDKSNTKTCTFDNTTVCGAQSCSGGQRTNKSVCDGLGNCPVQTKTNCDSNVCTADGSDCSGSCVGMSCGTGKYCAGSTCATLKNQGDSCSDKVECSTGNCVDGYCCESACTGTCQSCSATPGTCKNMTSPHANKSCSGTGTCASTCNGLAAECVFPPANTSCGSTSCLTTSTLQLAGTCSQGNGNCYQSTTDCTIQGKTCSNGACVCVPACAGKCGGNDGCGGNCPNTCGSQNCYNNTCCAASPQCGTRQCGSVSNTCGATLSCGACGAPGMTCSSSGSCLCPFGSPGCGNNACLGWGFESGAGTWHATVGANDIKTNVSTSTLHPSDGGSTSLTFSAEINPSSNGASIESSLCPSGNTSINNLRPSLEIMVDSDAPSLNINWIGKLAGSSPWTGEIVHNLMAANGVWYSLDGLVVSSGGQLFDTIQIVVSSNTYWQGNVFIDNIQIH
jgi:hypothetical protein